MENEPLVSYVICTFNSEDYIEDNIQSIKNQNYTNQEIVIVDNCSSDSTRKIIENNYPEVKFVVMPNSDYGACETFNIGFETAKGEYIAILDDDVELEEDWTNILVERLNESEDIGLVSPKIKEPSKTREPIGEITFFQGCGVLARKAALNESGYYDENYFIYNNEWDLAAKLLNRGYRLVGEPGTITFHKSDRNVSGFAYYYETRNKLWFYWKYFDRYNSIVFSLHHLVKKGVKALNDGYLVEFSKGYMSAWRRFFKYYIRDHETCKEIYRSWNASNILHSIKRKLVEFR